jgi:outer membrane lipoprotein carrier protein
MNGRDRVRRASIAASLLVLGFAPTMAEEPGAVLAKLQSWLDDTRRLEGAFIQSLVSGALGSGLEESGRFYLERPGKMRWDYTEPETKVALIAGDRTWLYVPEDRQLVLGRLEGEGELLPRLMTGAERLERLFEYELVDEPTKPAGSGARRIRLTPREDGDAVEAVTLTLRAPDYAIESAEVLDGAGNRTVYLFHDLVRNRDLPAGIFELEAEPGIDVVGKH